MCDLEASSKVIDNRYSCDASASTLWKIYVDLLINDHLESNIHIQDDRPTVTMKVGRGHW